MAKAVGKALALLLIAVAAGLLVYRLAAPRFLPSSPAASSPAPPPPAFAPASPPPQATPSAALTGEPSAPLAPPRSGPEQARLELETQRAGFYVRLGQALGADMAEARASGQDAAALEIFAAQNVPDLLANLFSRVAQARPYHYGFRRIVFYLPNPPGSADAFRLAAEATASAQGAWTLFPR